MHVTAVAHDQHIDMFATCFVSRTTYVKIQRSNCSISNLTHSVTNLWEATPDFTYSKGMFKELQSHLEPGMRADVLVLTFVAVVYTSIFCAYALFRIAISSDLAEHAASV